MLRVYRNNEMRELEEIWAKYAERPQRATADENETDLSIITSELQRLQIGPEQQRQWGEIQDNVVYQSGYKPKLNPRLTKIEDALPSSALKESLQRNGGEVDRQGPVWQFEMMPTDKFVTWAENKKHTYR